MAKEKNRPIISVIPIQHTNVYYKRWSNYENLNRLLMTEIKEWREKDKKGLPGSNAGCWRSSQKFKCEKELFVPLSEMLSSYAESDLPNKTMDAELTYWTNVNEPGSSNIFHTHYRADADLSGVYYVQGTGTGLLRFGTHEQIYRMIPSHLNYSNMIGHEPHDGDLLLFPSYLLHDVIPNPHPTRQRISIGYNVKITIKERQNKRNGK